MLVKTVWHMLNALINRSFKAFSSLASVETESQRYPFRYRRSTGPRICVYKLSLANEFDKSIGAIHLGRPLHLIFSRLIIR